MVLQVLLSVISHSPGTAIVDPDGIVQHFSVNAETVGRNVDETLRILQALQFAREHGEVRAGRKETYKILMVNLRQRLPASSAETYRSFRKRRLILSLS